MNCNSLLLLKTLIIINKHILIVKIKIPACIFFQDQNSNGQTRSEAGTVIIEEKEIKKKKETEDKSNKFEGQEQVLAD